MRALILFILFFYSTAIFSKINLQIKLEKMVDQKLIEISKDISTEFDKEYVIQDQNFPDKVVVKLKRFASFESNGVSVEPIQINVKRMDTDPKRAGNWQSMTSFYKNEANFDLMAQDNSNDKIKMNLNFKSNGEVP